MTTQAKATRGRNTRQRSPPSQGPHTLDPTSLLLAVQSALVPLLRYYNGTDAPVMQYRGRGAFILLGVSYGTRGFRGPSPSVLPPAAPPPSNLELLLAPLQNHSIWDAFPRSQQVRCCDVARLCCGAGGYELGTELKHPRCHACAASQVRGVQVDTSHSRPTFAQAGPGYDR